jgi:hypothetical protein
MRPFHMIALPHKDILEGRLTMDVFAADLWNVFKGEAVDDYKNPDSFFQKTYPTFGLRNLLKIAGKRLRSEGGDSVIQIQTPFGGGKTHSLIALYHAFSTGKYVEDAIKANVVVIVGTAISPKEENGKITGTIWGEIERQLEGEVKELDLSVSPGRDKLEELFRKHQPLLILMDEVLQYTTKAAGIKVGDSNLASQTMAFMQELTECVKSLKKTLLVLTLPSSIIEHYDESAEKLFVQLQKVSGRMEKIYTPVAGEEIYEVVRRRLFREIDNERAREVVEEFVNYYEREGIIQEKAEYRDKMMKSYPFHPEVIDVLHNRWGSIPTFQRTRGVLRILSLAIYRLKDSSIPLIRPCDLDLTYSELAEELIKHIGREYESVLSADITGSNANAKKVDKSTGVTYQGLNLGTKLATAIFLYSFSGGEKGASLGDLKLACSDTNVPSSVITDVIEGLKSNLFYLQSDITRYFFTSQPNLNSILVTRMSEIDNGVIKAATKSLTERFSGKDIPVYIWPSKPKDIPDSEELKLIILPENDGKLCKNILENYGENPRVNKNTLFFLCPMESERFSFENWLRKLLAWRRIDEDKSLNLTELQQKEVKKNLGEMSKAERIQLRSFYRLVYVPSKDGFREIDLGIPVFGKTETLSREVINRLKAEGEIVEKLSPLLISEKYLRDKDYVETGRLFKAMLSTPGEPRVTKSKFISSIRDGVKQGIFGSGILRDGSVECLKFKENTEVLLSDYEVIIRKEICEKPKAEEGRVEEELEGYEEVEEEEKETGILVEDEDKEKPKPPVVIPKFKKVKLSVEVPRGKFSEFYTGVILPIEKSFGEAEIKIEIEAKNGEIPKSEYENKVKETLLQINAKFKEEELEE